jgi:hypothetical protein
MTCNHLNQRPPLLAASKCEAVGPLTNGQTMTSPNGLFTLGFKDGGKSLTISDSMGQDVWKVGPWSNCAAPLTLKVLPGGDLAVVDKHGQVVWHSMTSCISTSTCYSYAVTVGGVWRQWGSDGGRFAVCIVASLL